MKKLSSALIKLIYVFLFKLLEQESAVRVAELLILKGANVNAVDKNLKSILYLAIENGIEFNNNSTEILIITNALH